MAESEVPQTPDLAVRAFISLFVLGAVLHGFDVMKPDGVSTAIKWWIGGGFLALFDWYWIKVKGWLGPQFAATANSVATNFRWWAAALIVVFAFVTATNIYERINLPATLPFPPHPGAPNSQNATLIEWLQKAQGERDQARQALASVQSGAVSLQAQLSAAQTQLQRNDQEKMRALTGEIVPKDPYPPGPVLPDKKYTRDEAAELIVALREITMFAKQLTDAFQPSENLFEQRFRITWPSRIVDLGLDNATAKLQTLLDNIKWQNAKLHKIVAEYPEYADDLNRVIGSTGLDDFDLAVTTYINAMADLKQIRGVDWSKAGAVVAGCRLQGPVTFMWQKYNNVSNWSKTFINERSPAARKELEKYL